MRAVAPLAVQVIAVLQPSELVPSASATLPAPAASGIGVGSVKSGAGSGSPVVLPASCTRKSLPGGEAHIGQLRELARVGPEVPGARRAGVLERAAAERHGRIPAVVELDEVVGIRRAGVAATAVDLGDHEIGGRSGLRGAGEGEGGEQGARGDEDAVGHGAAL